MSVAGCLFTYSLAASRSHFWLRIEYGARSVCACVLTCVSAKDELSKYQQPAM